MSEFVFGSLHNRPIPRNSFGLGDAFNDDHTFKPEFVYHKLDEEVNPRYFGIELEMELPLGIRETARNVLAQINTQPYFYFKYDGSVTGGCEMNSHPMSMGVLEQQYHVTDVLHQFDTKINDSCGLHIHIDRSSFKNEKAVMAFYENIIVSRKLMLWLSKRTKLKQVRNFADLIIANPTLQKYDKGLEKFCFHRKNLGSEVKFNVKNVIDNFLRERGGEYSARYSGVNLTNSSTVEVRFLKGTTDWDLVMKYVKLFDFIADLSNKGVVVKSPYELIKLSMGTDIFEFLKEEQKSFIEMNDKIVWLEQNNNLFVSHSGDMFYRVPNKSMQNHDYVIPTEVIERLMAKNHVENETDKDSIFLGNVTYQRRTNPDVINNPKKYVVLRRIKTVAFIKEPSETVLYHKLKKFLLYVYPNGLKKPDVRLQWGNITSTQTSAFGDIRAMSIPTQDDSYSTEDTLEEYLQRYEESQGRVTRRFFDSVDELFHYINQAISNGSTDLITQRLNTISFVSNLYTVPLESTTSISYLPTGGDSYFYDTVSTTIFSNDSVLSLSNYYGDDFRDEVVNILRRDGRDVGFDEDESTLVLNTTDGMFMVNRI